MSAHDRLADGAAVLSAVGVAWAMKRFYSAADFDDLTWVLAPTRRLVEWMTGASFEPEAHRAYLSRELQFEIVPSCAGVNFMIALFCSLACGLVHVHRGCGRKLAWLLASGAAAWGLTVLANATRIAVALGLHVANFSVGPLGADRLHRISGVAVYSLFLCLGYGAAVRFTGARREPSS